jgi:hypothetical protein
MLAGAGAVRAERDRASASILGWAVVPAATLGCRASEKNDERMLPLTEKQQRQNLFLHGLTEFVYISFAKKSRRRILNASKSTGYR